MNDFTLTEKMIIRKAKETYGDEYPKYEQQVMDILEQYRQCQTALRNLNAHDDDMNNYEQLFSQFDLYPKAVEKLFENNAIPDIQRIMVTLLHFIGLSGEVGELGEKIKKCVRDGSALDIRNPEIAKEMGDCEWYLTRLQSDFGYAKNEILLINFNKLYKRLQQNKLHGSGDDREE